MAFQSADGLPQLMGNTPDTQLHIITVGFDRVDFLDANEYDAAIRFEGEPLLLLGARF